MAEASRRAARSPGKGGLPNLIFAVAAAERLPDELCGGVDELTVLFPWGSLLRGALALDPAAAGGIASLLAPGGHVRALVSITDRDTATSALRPLTTEDRDDLARRWSAFGLQLTTFAEASPAEVAASGSTWAKRLGAVGRATERPVWRIELRRVATGPRAREG
jgi:16S rRNA (adenine(1408)-N(1))-methyltransferase